MKMLAKLVLAGAVSMVSLPAMAHDRHHGGRHCDHDKHHGQYRGAVYIPAPAPVRQEVYVPGHWSRRNHGHVWIEAAWSLPPQPAWVWVAPQWVWTGVSWQWQEGHWTDRS